MIEDLAPVRRVLDRVLLVALWLHVPLIALLAWRLDGAAATLAGTAALVAALATLLWAARTAGRVPRAAIALAAVGMISLLLAAARGSVWQVDVHMYYFAMLAILAAYCDWVVILVAAGAIALHHLTLNFLAPALLFPGGADVARVLLHAVVVVGETAALTWMSLQVHRLLAAAARAVARAEAAGQEAARMRQAQAEAVAQGTEKRRVALRRMAEQIESGASGSVTKIGERTAEVLGIARQMGSLAGRSGQSARDATEAAQLALGNAQTAANAAEELAASIHEINGRVGESARVVDQAVAAGQDTRVAIETLSERVRQIGAVADLINGIAAETNLLALNATIEAARAGEAGRGFSVVAGAVKQLATQTARCTEEIATHIQEVSAATAAAVEKVGRIDTTIRQISDISGAIATALDSQGSATAEIARNVTQTAAAVQDMAHRNAAVSHDAEQAGQYAHEVLANTSMLGNFVTELKGTMIRIVRTSTDEVDRRCRPRLEVALACEIEVAGRRFSVRLADISTGGAMVLGLPDSAALDDLSPGVPGRLRLPGLGGDVAFNVLRLHDEGAHLAFAPDHADSPKLQAFVARLAAA